MKIFGGIVIIVLGVLFVITTTARPYLGYLNLIAMGLIGTYLKFRKKKKTLEERIHEFIVLPVNYKNNLRAEKLIEEISKTNNTCLFFILSSFDDRTIGYFLAHYLYIPSLSDEKLKSVASNLDTNEFRNRIEGVLEFIGRKNKRAAEKLAKITQ